MMIFRFFLVSLLMVTPAFSATMYVNSTSTKAPTSCASRAADCSTGDPCQPSNALACVSAGDTVIFKGSGDVDNPTVYTGSGYVLDCRDAGCDGISGTSGSRITVQPDTDGTVLLNANWETSGSNNLSAIYLDGNNYWTVQGFNACCSQQHVVANRGGSSYNEFKEIVAWDAGPINNATVINCSGFNSLFEDVAAFGTGRKMINIAGGGNCCDGNVIRRAWTRWEGHVGADSQVRQGVSLWYQGRNNIFENILATLDNGSMNGDGTDTYYLVHEDLSRGAGPYDVCEVDQMRGIVSRDQNKYEVPHNISLLGSIVYLQGAISTELNCYQRLQGGSIDGDMAALKICCGTAGTTDWGAYGVTIDNVATFIDPDNTSASSVGGIYGVQLGRVACVCDGDQTQPCHCDSGDNDGTPCPGTCNEYTGDPSLSVSNLSVVTTRTDSSTTGSPCGGRCDINDDWTMSDLEGASTVASLNDTIYIGNGARVCYRYEDGSETSTKLWPWPMNDRIESATTYAADVAHQHQWPDCSTDPCTLGLVTDPHQVADVTADIVSIFGAIPSQCTTDGTYECSDSADNDGDGDVDYPDDSGCSGTTDNSEASCGDNFTDPAETCDGTDLNDETCVTQGYTSGTLACAVTCDAYDYTSCVSELSACQNTIDDDGDGLTDYPDDTGCANAADDDETECGDNFLDAGESCDGTQVANSCENEGFVGGEIACNATCDGWDTSACFRGTSGVVLKGAGIK